MSPKKTTAMTLLEIIISLAILGWTVAIIGELSRTSFRDARLAREFIQAKLLAESILAKVRLGIIEMETAIDVPVGSAYNNMRDIVVDTHAVSEGNTSIILWYYSVEVTSVPDFDYLVEIAVTVRQNIPQEQRPVVCRLVRWLALEPEEEEDDQNTVT